MSCLWPPLDVGERAMRILHIYNLHLQIDAYGKDATVEGKRIVVSLNQILSKLSGDPTLFWGGEIEAKYTYIGDDDSDGDRGDDCG